MSRKSPSFTEPISLMNLDLSIALSCDKIILDGLLKYISERR